MKKIIFTLSSLLIALSTFGQTTWYEIPTGTNSKLNAIDFPSNNVGYIVGEDTTILKTTDGGQTWTQLPINGINIIGLDDDLTDVDFVNENFGFLVSGYSGVYQTVDGGQSWTVVSGQTSNMCFPHTVYPFSETDFFVGGAGCFEGAIIDRNVNGTWTTGNLGMNFWDSNQTALEISFSDANKGLVATRSEYMLRTLDGGSTWDTISTGVQENLTSVVMVNDTLCYAGYEDLNFQGYGVLKSVDGGLNWAPDVNSVTFLYPSYLCVHAAANGDVYSGAWSSSAEVGVIFESSDGVNWDNQSTEHAINDITSYGSDITFGVGDSGYVIVNTPIAELSTSHFGELNFDVYPNPFQDEFFLRNSSMELMRVTVFDASGRVCQVQELEVGSQRINFEEFMRGVYFLEVNQGDLRSVQRIIKQ